MSTHEHKKQAPRKVTLGIITVSTTRALVDDVSGNWIREQAGREGHDVVYHQLVKDDQSMIAATLQNLVRTEQPLVVILTGGTGITKKDVTIEAVSPLFAMLSFEEIGSAGFLSRATAGVIENAVVFCIPGSLNACKLACQKLIFPELGHLVKHIMD
jgi:molybdopterin adenylyltransferase